MIRGEEEEIGVDVALLLLGAGEGFNPGMGVVSNEGALRCREDDLSSGGVDEIVAKPRSLLSCSLPFPPVVSRSLLPKLSLEELR